MVAINNSYRTQNPGRYFGSGAGLGLLHRGRGDRFNRFVSDVYAPTASTPDGYGTSVYMPPLTAGAMGGVSLVDVGTSAALVRGGAVAGSADVSITESTPSMSLTTGMSGAAAVALAVSDANLALTLGMEGSATVTLSASDWNLGMIVPVAGSASFAFSHDANLKGLLSMSGESTSFTELSPNSLASAVLAAQVEGVIDVGGALRLMLAPLAGKATGGGTTTITFRDTLDTKDRIVATVDSSGNRSAVTLDAS